MIFNTLRAPLRTTTPILLRRGLATPPLPLRFSQALPRLSTTKPIQVVVRGAASSVSGRPGSQTLGHAAENIKEEVGNSTADLAKTIAGGNYTSDAVSSDSKTFLGITDAVAKSVPQPYVVFGLAGALPYLGSSLTTAYLARQAGEAATVVSTTIDPGVAITVLHQALTFQTTYGAVLLSFLGALHWGFEFAGYGGAKGYSRLTLGTLPVIWGWSTLALDPMNALIAQWVGFTGLWWADMKATGAGWAPQWYSQYRFYLSILVGTCIIGSLAATSYWGPVGGHGFISRDLKEVRAQRMQSHPDNKGTVGGDIEALPAPVNADQYVVIKKKQVPGEEKKED